MTRGSLIADWAKLHPRLGGLFLFCLGNPDIVLGFCLLFELSRFSREKMTSEKAKDTAAVSQHSAIIYVFSLQYEIPLLT